VIKDQHAHYNFWEKVLMSVLLTSALSQGRAL